MRASASVGDVVLVRGQRFTVLRVLALGSLLVVWDGDRQQTIGAANVDAVLDDVVPGADTSAGVQIMLPLLEEVG